MYEVKEFKRGNSIFILFVESYFSCFLILVNERRDFEFL